MEGKSSLNSKPGECTPKIEDIIDQSVRELVRCGICLKLLVEPVSGDCNHSFCIKCIEDVLEKWMKCPQCQQPMNQEQLKPSKNDIHQILAKAIVKCRYHKDGCDWTNQYCLLEQHYMEDCPFNEVPCQHVGCDFKTQRKDLKAHELVCLFKGEIDEIAKVNKSDKINLNENGKEHQDSCVNDIKNGFDVVHYENGDTYTGQLMDNKKHGQGTFLYANGGKYVGNFINDIQNGEGKFYYPNGDRYEGQWPAAR